MGRHCGVCVKIMRDLSSSPSCSVLLLLLLSTGLLFLGGQEFLHYKGLRCSSIAAVGEVRARISVGWGPSVESHYLDQHLMILQLDQLLLCSLLRAP